MLPAKNYDKPPPSSNSNFQTRAPNALKISVRGAQHPPSSNGTISGINADNFFKHLQSTWVHLSYYVTDFYEKWRFLEAHHPLLPIHLSNNDLYQQKSTNQLNKIEGDIASNALAKLDDSTPDGIASTHQLIIKTTRRKITAKNHSSFASAQYAMK